MTGKLVEWLRAHSVESLTRLACIIALVALAIMVASVLRPMPLLVIFATSVGQMIGGLAVLCYVIAVLMDVKRGSRRSIPSPKPRDASSAGGAGSAGVNKTA